MTIIYNGINKTFETPLLSSHFFYMTDSIRYMLFVLSTILPIYIALNAASSSMATTPQLYHGWVHSRTIHTIKGCSNSRYSDPPVCTPMDVFSFLFQPLKASRRLCKRLIPRIFLSQQPYKSHSFYIPICHSLLWLVSG